MAYRHTNGRRKLILFARNLLFKEKKYVFLLQIYNAEIKKDQKKIPPMMFSVGLMTRE